mmetsp:Transcript_10128/g.18238  ORF Transcript_10128/g.18238 Transcript_10128/m.18238 type:complete len:183 (-) Transcript_10128:205-753(-)
MEEFESGDVMDGLGSCIEVVVVDGNLFNGYTHDEFSFGYSILEPLALLDQARKQKDSLDDVDWEGMDDLTRMNTAKNSERSCFTMDFSEVSSSENDDQSMSSLISSLSLNEDRNLLRQLEGTPVGVTISDLKHRQSLPEIELEMSGCQERKQSMKHVSFDRRVRCLRHCSSGRKVFYELSLP